MRQRGVTRRNNANELCRYYDVMMIEQQNEIERQRAVLPAEI